MRYQNILHIDDDEDDEEIFLTALKLVSDEVGYIGITNPIVALQKLTEKEVRPDIIFLDLNMPEMNGQQFLINLYKDVHLKQIPIIILSTSAQQPTIHLMKDMGAQEFITKPGNFQELRKILHNILS